MPISTTSLLNTLFRFSVVGIFLFLAILFYLEQFHPRLQLHFSEAEFRSLAAACDQAVRVADMEQITLENISRSHIDRLNQALEIAQLPCKSYARLREYLLSQGVSQHALSALHIAATVDPSYPNLRTESASGAELDASLRVVIETQGLAPLPLKDYFRDPKFLLGERLFHDPRLSGYGDRSCATCHNLKYTTADVRKLEPRLDVAPEMLPEVPARNVPDLWNRDHNDVTRMLWDGRLEVKIAANLGGLSSPEGLDTSGFENLMALQSVRPIFSPDEMLGKPGPLNALAPEGNSEVRPEEIFARIGPLLIPDETDMSVDTKKYQELFQASYGLTRAEQIGPDHIGNALAHYIEIEFQTRDTPWDKYLSGDITALTLDQKRGALIFFGVGKCAVCHSGSLFSDFDFHSVGVPDTRKIKDQGRFYATGDPKDRFLFRTPPLRNITLTAPYFHNGQADRLIDAIIQHLDPYRYSREYTETGEHLMEPAEVSAISSILSGPRVVTGEQAKLLVKFLEALKDHRAGQPE